MASEHVRELNDGDWQSEVLESNEAVLVDFWAPWCGPCRAVAPHVDSIAHAYEGKLKVAKINIDDNRGVPQQYNIRSIPTILLFKNGQVVDQVVGAVDREQLREMVEKVLG